MTSDSSDSPTENIFAPPEGLDDSVDNGETTSQKDIFAAAKSKVAEANVRVAQLNQKIESIERVRNGGGDITGKDQDTYNEEVGEEDPAEIIVTLETDRDAAESAALEAKEDLEEQEKNLTPEDKLSIAIDDGMKILKGKPSMGDTIKAIMMMMAALQSYFKYIKAEFNKAMGKGAIEDGVEKKNREGDPRMRVRAMLDGDSSKTALQLKAEKETAKGIQETAVKTAETNLTTLQGKRPIAQRNVDKFEKELADVGGSSTAIEGKITDARRDLSKIDADIIAAQSKLNTAESGLQEIKIDIKDINDAVAKSKSDVSKLSSFLTIVSARLRIKSPELADLFGTHLDVNIGANGIDIALSFKKDGTTMKDVLKAFVDANMGSDLTQLGVNASTNQIDDPAKFINALEKLVTKTKSKA